LTLYPDDPLAPEAGLSLVSAWLDLKDFAQASELGGRCSARFPAPRLSGSFRSARAVAGWSLRHHDEAGPAPRPTPAAGYVDDDGRRRPSDNRALAWYILGQIHHARRDAAKAEECYEKVAAEFQDAREALQSLRERELALPEVTIARPGETARVELRSRNLA